MRGRAHIHYAVAPARHGPESGPRETGQLRVTVDVERDHRPPDR